MQNQNICKEKQKRTRYVNEKDLLDEVMVSQTVFLFLEKKKTYRSNQWGDIGVTFTNIVARRIVGTDDVRAPVGTTLLVTTTNFGGGLPHNLGEVIVNGTAGTVGVVVTFAVPSVDRPRGGVADGQVFPVLTTGVGQSARTVVIVGVVLRICLQGGVPCQVGDPM